MSNEKLLELWNDMWKEGNWIPSIPQTLEGVTVAQATWTPNASSHCIWQEVAHITFWRQATMNHLAGLPGPTAEEGEKYQFAIPSEQTNETWTAEFEKLHVTQVELAKAIEAGTGDLSRLEYHLIHDAYHLGRITHLLMMMDVPPKY